MIKFSVSVTFFAALPNLKTPLNGHACTLPAVLSLDCVLSLQAWDVGVFAESLTFLGLLVAVLHFLAGLTIFRLTEL